jgi:hypothetical protein
MRPSCLLAVVLAAAPIAAQVCVTGVVERFAGPSVCMQPLTHRLVDTEVYLIATGATVDLDRHLGQKVRVSGRDIGVTCHVLDVFRVDPPPASLVWCGSGSTGCPLKVKVCPVGFGRFWIFAGLRRGYAPLGCAPAGWFDGTLLIGDPVIQIAAGGAGACGEVTLPVPFDNALVGVELFFQGARQDVGPLGPLQLSDAVRVRLAPFMPPCAPTSC